MFRTGTNIPEQPKAPVKPKEMKLNGDMAAEFDRLYLEKCQEVNHLRERFKIAIEQKIKLREELNKVKAELKALQTADLISREKVLEALAEGRRTVIAFPSNISTPDVETIISGYNTRYENTVELINEIPAASSAATIRELAAAPLVGFIPDVAEPEPLPESLMEELPVWTLQTASTQDILCLSSALKNISDIYGGTGSEMYNKLYDLMDGLIDTYCKEG